MSKDMKLMAVYAEDATAEIGGRDEDRSNVFFYSEDGTKAEGVVRNEKLTTISEIEGAALARYQQAIVDFFLLYYSDAERLFGDSEIRKVVANTEPEEFIRKVRTHVPIIDGQIWRDARDGGNVIVYRRDGDDILAFSDKEEVRMNIDSFLVGYEYTGRTSRHFQMMMDELDKEDVFRAGMEKEG